MFSMLFVLLAALLPLGSSLKFLVYNPKFGGSHALYMGKLADQLAKAGHDVVVLQSVINPNITFTGHTHPGVRLIERRSNVDFTTPSDFGGNVWVQRESLTGLRFLGNAFNQNCKEELRDAALMQQLRDEQFDLGIGEYFVVCGLGIFDHIGIKKWITAYGGAIPADHLAHLGVPPMQSFTLSTNPEHGFLQRLGDMFGYFLTSKVIFPELIDRTAWAFGEVLGKPVDPYKLIARSTFLWENAEEFVEMPHPISHKIIGIAGLGMRGLLNKTKPLEKQFADIFDKAKKGVVYMSFGSVAQSSTMPAPVKKAFLEAFNAFPEIEFIWKYETLEEDIAKDYDNVHIGKWLPQREILLHPKTLAFITHGGMNSITEATWSGVPMLMIPLFGDQPRNAPIVGRKGFATYLDKSALFRKESIIKAIREIVEHKSYKEKAMELSEIVRNKPQSPEERLVKSAEFAARFNVEPHIDMDGRHLNTSAFYNFDVIIASILIFAASLLLISYAVYKTVKYVFTVTSSTKGKTE